jgi:hypothetical protein
MYIIFPENWSANNTEASFIAQPVTELEAMFVRGVTLKQEWGIYSN